VAEMVCRLKPQSVLDLCAAPGGKTCYIARFGNVERLVANDQAAERMARMRDNRQRLDLNFDIQEGDARHLTFDEKFDLVLLDAPCSGLGIIGRHPEIKFLKKKPAEPELRELQAELLEAGWQHVKPGGHLLYTVCSLDKREIPKPIEGSEPVIATSDLDFLKRLPCHLDGCSFFFSPTPTFDGFSGMLLRKP